MGTAFGHPAMIEHDDLVELVEPVEIVGDEQGGPDRQSWSSMLELFRAALGPL
jgi:hypothetical protein